MRGGNGGKTVYTSSTKVTLQGLDPSAEYDVEVAAIDLCGRMSGYSDMAQLNLLGTKLVYRSSANSTGCCKRTGWWPHLTCTPSQHIIMWDCMWFCEVLTMIAAVTYLYSIVAWWHSLLRKVTLFHASMETLKCRQFSFFITTIPIFSCTYFQLRYVTECIQNVYVYCVAIITG